MLDWNTWNHLTVSKKFVLRIVTWSRKNIIFGNFKTYNWGGERPPDVMVQELDCSF